MEQHIQATNKLREELFAKMKAFNNEDDSGANNGLVWKTISKVSVTINIINLRFFGVTNDFYLFRCTVPSYERKITFIIKNKTSKWASANPWWQPKTKKNFVLDKKGR